MLKSYKIQVLSGLLAFSLLTGCSGGVLPGTKVAQVNSEIITQSDFQQGYDRMLRMMNLDPKVLKDEKFEPMVEMFKKIALQNLILNSLVQQEAKKRNIEVSAKEVQDVYELQVSQIGGEDALNEQLQKLGLTKQLFMEQLKEQLVKDKLITDVAGNKVKVSEQEARQFYNQHPEQFDMPEQVRARHILVAAEPQQIEQDLKALKQGAGDDEIQRQIGETMLEKKKKADALLQQAKTSPKAFESLAKKHSDDKGSAKDGGDLGYFSREVMVKPFSDAAFSAKPGQIYPDVVQSQFGFHVIQVVDRKAPEKRGFEQAKAQIIANLENQRKAQFMESWLEEVKRKAKIDIEPAYDFDKKAAEAAKQQEAGKS